WKFEIDSERIRPGTEFKKSHLTVHSLSSLFLKICGNNRQSLKHLTAVGTKRIKSSAANQAFNRAAVKMRSLKSLAEIKKIFVSAVSALFYNIINKIGS